MLLDEVRDALAEQADLVPAAATEPAIVLARARRDVRRRRVVRATALIGALVVVIGGIAFAVGRNEAPNNTIVVVSTPTSTSASPTTTPATVYPPLALTAEQLRAHAGVGAPAGWDPVDAGDARVFVPSNWALEAVGECLGGRLPGPGLVSLGRLAQFDCNPQDQFPVPSQAVSIMPWQGQATRPLVRTVHGYRVYANPRPDAAGWTLYQVPQLHAEIALRGAAPPAILDSLAPSANVVALAFATQPPTAGHTVTTDGIRVTIPRSWTVTTPAMMACEGLGAADALSRIEPGIASPNCPFIGPTLATEFADGAWLFTAPRTAADLPAPSQPPSSVFHHGTTTIRVYGEINHSTELDVFVQRAGSSIAHELYVGLGRDGRVAGGVLASLEATT